MKGAILNKLSCHVSVELRFGIKSIVKGQISTVTQPFMGCHATLPQKALRDIQKTAAKETNNEADDLGMSSSSEQMTAG